jgi:hypothetical protein
MSARLRSSLVGRHREVGIIRRAIATASAGPGQVLVLEGEAQLRRAFGQDRRTKHVSGALLGTL